MNTTYKNRGELTKSIQEAAVSFLGREITLKELRLYPYIDYCLKHFHKLELNKISREEKYVLDKLEEEGHITFSSEWIMCTKKFYNYMQEVLAHSYVIEFINKKENI